MQEPILHINHHSDVPKYQQIITSITDAISDNRLSQGSILPSVNAIVNGYKVSRDTVFKAYSILKENGVVDAVPNKGYFVAADTRKILLVLDTFKAYKEVLYHAFKNNLPDNVIADVQFHHYNIENFKTIIQNSVGKYYKYIVMNFNHPDVKKTIAKLNSEKLLQIDWNIHTTSNANYVCQDFGKSFYDAISEAIQIFKKYKRIDFIYPSFTDHPIETVTYFEKFCKEHDIDFQILKEPQKFEIEKHVAYISVSDRMLGRFLEQCTSKGFVLGKDIGILSYNETPMKKFINSGISVISTDFKALGTHAARFISEKEPIQLYIPTSLILRQSL